MKKALSQSLVLALKGYSIKTERGKYYVSPTAHFEQKPQWAGPYRSLKHACTAIARKLEAEYVKREARLNGGVS